MEEDSPSRESFLKNKAAALHALASGPIAASAAKLSDRSRGIPSDRDFYFYNNFPDFKTPVREITSKSEGSLRALAASDHLWGRKKPPPFPDDLDEAFDWLINLNDEFLERFGISMDQFKFLREKEEETGSKIGAEDSESGFQLVYGKKKRGGMREYEKDESFPASSSLLGVKVAVKDNKTTAARSKVPFHIPTIPRPQDEYNILVNNKNQPFEHVWLEKSDDGSRFIHPLEKLSVVDFVDRSVGEGEPVKPLSLEKTPFKLVEQVKELKELASKLKGVTEFAVDLEHNQYRSFQGLTCLMQISTRTEDFVIDTLKLRIHVGPYLREVFEDPLKRKVMHGADRDILWLQRDFGIYVCNLFDTGQASRVLQMERNSLEYLLNHFCEVKANKEYQNAEWRLRPLPGEMLKYAREDTHYLLYIYDLMKVRLQSMSTNGTDLLLEVHKRSNEICLQLYEKEQLTDTSYLHIYGLQEAEFNSQQLAVVAGLCHWRDTVARAENESAGYILPNKALLEIARQVPLSSGKLRQMVKSKHPFVERYLSSVIGIIRSSIAGCSSFESIAKQLKNRQQETSALQSVEVVGCKKKLLPSTEDPMGSTVSLEDSLGGGTITSIAQSSESAPAHIASVNDCGTPPNSLQFTTEISSYSGIQQKQKWEAVSVSATGESLIISDGIGVMDKEKMGNGSLQPVRKEKMASVQTLKRPTTRNNSNVIEPSDGSTSCPSSTYYSATQSPCSDFLVDDPPIYASVQPTKAPNLPKFPSSPSFSLRHSIEQLPCAPNLDKSEQDFDASCGPTWSWNLDSNRLRSCDVYVGFNGRQPLLLRLVKWLRAELEMHGVSCFSSDRNKCGNAFDHAAARTAINVTSLGVVIITPLSFSNPYCIEELHVFLERKRLIPIFLGLSKDDCIARDIIERKGKLWESFGGELWTAYGGIERKWKDVICALSDIEFKLQVNVGNLRDCIMDVVEFVGVRLGRRCIVQTVARWRALAADELPYMRNVNFIGRKEELRELEYMLFGNVEGYKEEDKLICTRTKERDRNVATVLERNNTRLIRERSLQEYKERSKGKKPMDWKESQDHREMHGNESSKNDHLYSNGMACVSGESGFGKTELLLEFAYRFSQRYKMVLWVGGEARYLRENYMKLLSRLGVDVELHNKLYLEENCLRSFADMEEETIQRVRRELMRDVPFLLIIDNLECERDWWDGRSIRELLPPLGVATHVLISTRLPRVMNIKSLRLLYMSGAEAMSLMKGNSTNLKTEGLVALRLIEEKLGRLPLGLALVGSLISEFHIDPPKLLDSISKVSCNELAWNAKEKVILKRNPFLLQLLELCFSMLDHAKSCKKFATRMLEASSWFAPSPIPISMLVLAARGSFKEQYHKLFWKKLHRVVFCTCMPINIERPEVEALSMLIRLGIGRASVKSGFITFHNIIKEYARKRGNNNISSFAIQAINSEGFVSQHSDHIWAACFLLFKFDSDPVLVKLSIRDLLFFIKHLVLPLVSWSYTVFSKYSDVLELLQLSTEALEALEDSFINEANVAQQKSSCLSFKSQSAVESDLLLYQDLAHLRAILLETRARLVLRGGQYDIAQQLCQTAVSIKEVIYGREHPETQSTHETFERVIRYRSKF